jgi:capsular exopolysaccharide synthesis family protein
MDMNQSAHKAPATPSAGDSQLLQASLLRMAQGQGDNAGSGPPALSATPTLSGLLHTLRRRWALAFGLATVLAAAAVAAVFVFMPPKYVASLRIQISARQASAEDLEFPIFKANMAGLVKSPLVLSAALNEKTADGRDIKDLEIVRSKGMGALDWLELALKADITNHNLGPEILLVSLAADQPDEAAELLNAIAKAFMNEYTQIERSKKERRLHGLRASKESVDQELATWRKVLDTQSKNLEIKDRDAADVQRQQLLYKLNSAETARRTYDDEIAKAESHIIASKARINSLDQQPVPDEILYDLFSKDPSINGHLDRIAKIEIEIADAYRKYEEPYSTDIAVPLKREKIKIMNLKEQRERQLQPKIEARWRASVRTELNHQVSLETEKISNFTRWKNERMKEIQVMERQVKELGVGNQNKLPQIMATEDKIDVARKALDNISQKISELDFDSPQARVRIVQPANPPTLRDTRNQTRLAGAGGLSLFIMALFGVAFLEFRARKISMPEEVTHGLGLNVIGTIPAMPTRSRKPSSQDGAAEQQWLNQLQESVDAIRTVILHQARTESLHVIMVTSANGGEGKTTLATQLAASLSRAWKRTLIIDGDLRHPATHKLFEVPAEPGLAEVLRGEVEPAEAIRATPFSRLWVLPAGNGDNHAIQALAQDNVRTLFEQWKLQYDFIIIDSPPVLPVTDTLLLGSHVDGVVMSVLRDVSRAPAIYAAQQKLAPLGVTMLGAVVLGTEPEFSDKNYRYALAQAGK